MKGKQEGFTLIELLAVIIILGVLLLIAIPTMNGFIDNARKDTFITTAKQYIDAVRYSALMGDIVLPDPNKYTIVSTKNIELDQGSKKSSFNEEMNYNYTYVTILNLGTVTESKYVYYYTGIDVKHNGIYRHIEESKLARSDVIKNMPSFIYEQITSIYDYDYDGTLSIDGHTVSRQAVYLP